MPVEIRDQGPSITCGDVDAFEARIGHVIPPDYRAFLLRFNGGVPAEHVIRNSAIGDVGVQLFFGIGQREHFDIDARNQAMRGRWPGRFLAIAIGDCGDFFLLSLEAPDVGGVFFWNHEEESEEGEKPTEANLYQLGNSFNEFWEQVEPSDPDQYLAEKGILFDDDLPQSNGHTESGGP